MKKLFTLILLSTLLFCSGIINAQTTLTAKVYGLDGETKKYGKLYVPKGEKYRIKMRPSAGTTIGVYRAYVDGTDIYLSKLDVQGGYFWIDAINTDHALVVRSTSNDDVVAEVVSAEQDAMMLDEGYYYFDQSEAKKNKLKYATNKIDNSTLQESSPYATRSIYVMANPARHGLAFALLDPVSSHRDLGAGSLYILTKKTSSARQLNVVWLDDEDSFDNAESVSTEINSLESSPTDDAPAYSLDGRRLMNTDRSSVYIRNGRVYSGKK